MGYFKLDLLLDKVGYHIHASLNVILIQDGLELGFQRTLEQLADKESQFGGRFDKFDLGFFLLEDFGSALGHSLLAKTTELNRIIFHRGEEF